MQGYHRCQEEGHHRCAEVLRQARVWVSAREAVRMSTVCIRPDGRDGDRGHIRHLLSTRGLANQEGLAMLALYRERGDFVNAFIWVTV
jgi:hypothetical protein